MPNIRETSVTQSKDHRKQEPQFNSLKLMKDTTYYNRNVAM